MASADSKGASADVAATKEIQESAKWLIASLGAVAAIMVAGLSFATLGKFDDLGSPRLWATIIGTLAALAGVILLLSQTIDVLVVEPVDLDDFSDLSDLEKRGLGTSVIAPAASVDELYTEISRLLACERSDYQSHLADTADDSKRQTYLISKNKTDYWMAAAGRAVDRLRLHRVRAAFRNVKAWLWLKVVVVVIGVGSAAWGLTAEDPTAESLTIATVLKIPSEVLVQFSEVDFDAEPLPPFAAELTEECVNSGVAHPAVALESEGEEYTIALTPSELCPAKVVTVGPSDAKVALPESDG